jgi:diguanylate cyclase (GGDEF)-like protein
MVIVCLVIGAQISLSLLVPRGFGLTAFGDLIQCVLLAVGTVSFLSNVKRSPNKTKLFWGLMSLGCGMWLCSQVLWTYFEVFLRQETPNPFVGDVILFLHIVPMMAALALQPQLRQDRHSARLGSLDFVLLFTWWLYLYAFIAIPWQYVYPRTEVYGRSFDLVYFWEHAVFLGCLALVWRRSTAGWKRIYAHLFGAALLYAAGSIAASEAIDLHVYYTGSLYDLPLVTAMAWFAGIGFMARNRPPEEPVAGRSTDGHGIWTARLALGAVFSTPLMAAWAEFGEHAPQPVRTYQLLLTFGVMILMGALVFLKQHLLDGELINLLSLSRHNLDEMRGLKDELENKEQSLRWHSLELQRKNLELQEISFTDPLTGVWNRRYLEEILVAEAGQVMRNYERVRGQDGQTMDHRDLVFIMVDMDFFKQVNDQHGHPAGDRLLQRVAERLSRVVRKSDVIIRWGGEEFLIMSRSADAAGTPLFCSRILEVMGSEPFDLGHGISVRKTCSIGFAPYPWSRSAPETICAEEVIELADAALYRAKAWGRNQGVGLLPSELAAGAPEAIRFSVIRAENSRLTRVVKVPYPGPESGTFCSVEDTAPLQHPSV